MDDEGWPQLVDGSLVLRVLRPDDLNAWKLGEDDQQIRWFAAPGPAPLENIAAAIDTRAVRLASQWALDHLSASAVVAVIDESNTASLGVARAAGFELEGPAEPWEHSESGTMLRLVLATQ